MVSLVGKKKKKEKNGFLHKVAPMPAGLLKSYQENPEGVCF